MNGVIPALVLSVGLVVSPAQKTEIGAVDIVKQELQAQTETAEDLSCIVGTSSVKWKDLAKYFEKSGGIYPAEALAKGGAPDLKTFCKLYIDEAKQEGVRAEVAFAQAMKETGFLKYDGDMSIEQFNFAGLGTTGGGVPGNSFADVKTGIRAQIQHLKAYATEEELNNDCVDERYDYVVKASAPYVEWLGQQENPSGTGWAVAEKYGEHIVDMLEEIKKLQAE